MLAGHARDISHLLEKMETEGHDPSRKRSIILVRIRRSIRRRPLYLFEERREERGG